MDKITRMDLPRKRSFVYYIATDWHDVNYCQRTAQILVQTAIKTPRTRRRLILGGDFLDLPQFMPRNPHFKRHLKYAGGIEEYFIPAAEEAYAWGNVILDQLQEKFPEIVFVVGNHDYRLEVFQRDFCPIEYHPHFDLVMGLNLIKRGIPFINYNNWLDISPGRLTFTHGMYHNINHPKSHYDTVGHSVIYGHLHEAQMRPFRRRGDTQYAYAVPCMCHLAPEYLKNRDNKWDNGFATVVVKPNGNSEVNLHVVRDGELIGPRG